MIVTAEIFPTHRIERLELPTGATGIDLLRALQLAREAYVLVREDTAIPADETLVDDDRIRVIRVVSGGSLA